VVALVPFAISPLAAQVPLNPNAGIQMFSTNEFGVDLATSGINIDIPMRSKIGAILFSSRLFGTSQAYVANNTQGGNQAFYTNTGIGSYSDPTSVSLYSTSTSGTCTGHPSETYNEFTLVSITDPTGATHVLGNGISNVWKISQYCAMTPGPLITGDGSGYTFVVTSVAPASGSGTFSIYDHSGHHWNGTCNGDCSMSQTVTDPDNNTITDSFYGGPPVTDTLGTTPLSVNVANGQLQSYSYTDQDTTQYYTFGYDTTDHIQTNFACPGVLDGDFGGGYFLKSLTIPTGGRYTFAYEPTPNGNGFTNTNPATYFTGRIAKITFPSGGSISYAYSGGNNGYNCTSGVVPTMTVTVNDNNGEISSYSYVSTCCRNGSSGNYLVMKTGPAPANNQTLYYFAGNFEAQVLSYQGGCPTTLYTGCSGGGSLLKTTTTCYNGSLSNCSSPSPAPKLPITETDVYTSLNGSSSSNRVQIIYDCQATPTACYGNVVQVSQYDFGATAPTSQTFLLYGQSWNSTTLACNAYAAGTYINSTPCYAHTANASGTDLAKTQITYSNTGHPLSHREVDKRIVVADQHGYI